MIDELHGKSMFFLYFQIQSYVGTPSLALSPFSHPTGGSGASRTFQLSTVLVEPNLEASRRVDHWGAKTFPDTYSPKFQNAKNLKRHFWRREKCKPLWLYCVFVLFCGLFGASVVCLLDFVWLLVLFCLGSRVGRQRAKITLPSGLGPLRKNGLNHGFIYAINHSEQLS